MRILIDGRDVEMTPEIYARTQERVCYMLVLHQHVVSWVAVQFSRFRAQDDDICCQIDVWLHGIGSVTVRHSEPTAIESLEMAALRLREAVRRRLAQRGNPHLWPFTLPDKVDEPHDWIPGMLREQTPSEGKEYDDAV